jgi:tRNA(fMet)-specific endonuclease VapC
MSFHLPLEKTLVQLYMKLWTFGNNWGEKRKSNFVEFLRDYLVIYPDDKLCESWAQIKFDARRRGKPIDTADAWIAAVALMFDIPLVTHNRKHFENIKGLQIISET